MADSSVIEDACAHATATFLPCGDATGHVVVDTPLTASRSRAQQVKSLVDALRERGLDDLL